MDNQSSFDRDFKPQYPERKGLLRLHSHVHWIIVITAVVTVVTLLTIMSRSAEAMRSDEPTAASNKPAEARKAPSQQLAKRSERVTKPLAIPPPPQAPQAEEEPVAAGVHLVTVERGDTLSSIVQRLNIDARQVHNIMSLGHKTRTLGRLVPGETLEINVDEDGSILRLIYRMSATKSLVIKREDGELKVSQVERQYDTRVTFARGTVESSLFNAGHAAGLSDKLTMAMANIFGWDIDFVLDIRRGDTFTVMYEEYFLDGKKIDDGKILAAEFVNRGERYQAVRYTDASGHSDYYAPNGRSMRKAFLRTPVDFTRISSRFGRRYHPILGRWRSHDGVDYAAPRGTPIKAAGDGKVVWRGRKGGYGRTIVIKHGNKYSTLYAHMRGYARGACSGCRVKQGQTIGYVGSSGLATGPHLHYEFRVYGHHRNPLKVKLPAAKPIRARYRRDFKKSARPLLSQLNIISNPSVAFSSL